MFLWPVIALVGILSAVWFFGVRKPATIGDGDTIRRHLQEAHPEMELGDIAVDVAGTTALACAASGDEVLALFTMGNQVASRLLAPGSVHRVETAIAGQGHRLTIHLHDVGCPRVALTLLATDAAMWTARLEALVEGNGHHLPIR